MWAVRYRQNTLIHLESFPPKNAAILLVSSIKADLEFVTDALTHCPFYLEGLIHSLNILLVKSPIH